VPKLVDIGLMDREAKIRIFLGIQWDIGKMDRETKLVDMGFAAFLEIFCRNSFGCADFFLNGAVLDPLILLSESFYFFFPIV